ncbi:uncharacterized protein FIESC28_00415 [Fusarium coffeatum]|uniref:2EXR domain-containing protein n=1 Tax=Fusarium coffeatum TaxID=231269 RepID=A0A366SBY1_9HYPO|nr:uncharacterized protein FIESC28_00415 [Fusarium coffeatum]RBR26834.1 hypothetical protein FIESC28_00415 [Fusarium coffeatum]
MGRKNAARRRAAQDEPSSAQKKVVENDVTPSGSAHTNIDLMNPASRGVAQFPRFGEFPCDIRTLIWEQVLLSQRLIRISLEKRELSARNRNQRNKATKAKAKGREKNSFKQDAESPQDDIPKKPYCVVVEERYAMNKLFHVCTESRDTANRFYRVKIPCIYRWGSKTQEGTFYFRPDLDNIQVGISEYFPDFAFNLYQLDPRYVGLVNLTLPFQPNIQKLMDMDDAEKDIFRGVLLRLDNVSFAHMQEKTRAAPPPRRTLAYAHSMALAAAAAAANNDSDERQPPKPRTSWEPDCTGPMSTCIPSFDKLSQDPRKLGNDHTRPYFSFKNPIHIGLSWFRLLEILEAAHEHKVNYRFMMSYETSGRNIATREQATSWVQSQRKNFKSRALSEGIEHGECVQPAMEFWLYPMECVGSLVNYEGALKTAKDVLEGVQLKEALEKCVPELCLSKLV